MECPVQYGWLHCIKEKCGWWDDENGRCCMASIALSIGAIVMYLADMAESDKE